MNRSAGAYLGRLSKAGLVRYSRAHKRFILTEDGDKALDGA